MFRQPSMIRSELTADLNRGAHSFDSLHTVPRQQRRASGAGLSGTHKSNKENIQ